METSAQKLTRKNLYQLWWLRNVAIACEIIILAIVILFFQQALPIAPIFSLTGAQLTISIALGLRLRNPFPIHHFWVLLPLLLDVTGLFFLLYLCGGAGNPFTSLFILQVILAATLLSTAQTWLVTSVSIAYYTLLLLLPAGEHHMHSHHSTSLHMYGMWGSFVVLALLVAWFVTRMQQTIRRQSQLLASSEQLAMLGSMATSAAHELGTPLSSIALLVENSGSDLLKSQVMRCKDIISHMALKANVMRAESGNARQAADWVRALAANWQSRHPRNVLNVTISSSLKPVAIIAEYALEQAILNLLDNAADVSPDFIGMDVYLEKKILHIRITDHGAGFPDILLAKDALLHPLDSSKPGGMGMGLYLAQIVAQRLDGTLLLENLPDGGCATLSLPLGKLSV